MNTFRPLPVFNRPFPDAVEPANKKSRFDAGMPDIDVDTMFVRNSGMNHVTTGLLAKGFDRYSTPTYIGNGDLLYRLRLEDDEDKQVGFTFPTNRILNHQQINVFFRNQQKVVENEVTKIYTLLNQKPSYMEGESRITDTSMYKQIVYYAYQELFKKPGDTESFDECFEKNRAEYLKKMYEIITTDDNYKGMRWLYAFPEYMKTMIDLVGVCYNISKEPLPNAFDTYALSAVIEGEVQVKDIFGKESSRVRPLVVIYRKKNYCSPIQLEVVSRNDYISMMKKQREKFENICKLEDDNRKKGQIEEMEIMGLFSTLGTIHIPKDEFMGSCTNKTTQMLQNVSLDEKREEELEKCMSLVRKQGYIRMAIRIRPFI
jgi:hypothetical protein